MAQSAHDPFSVFPAIVKFGPDGRLGTVYTTRQAGVVKARLLEAASVPTRWVSLRVHDEYGWHEVFVRSLRLTQRSMRVASLCNSLGEQPIEEWIDSEDAIVKDGEMEVNLGQVDGYQLVVYNGDRQEN
jgi:hypothetical protein